MTTTISNPEQLLEKTKIKELRHLDLVMEINRLAMIGQDSQDLQEALARCSAELGVPPALLYQDICITNPLESDPRTFFTEEDDRQAEILFYLTHKHIELITGKAVSSIEKFLSEIDTELPEPERIRMADAILDECILSIQGVIEEFSNLNSRLSPEIFGRMRRFYKNPDPHPGPSGKFSAGIFCLDAVCVGNEPSFSELTANKLQEIAYFPRTSLSEDLICGQVDMQRIASKFAQGLLSDTLDLKRYINSLNNESLSTKLNHFLAQLMKSKQIHFGSIGKYIPREERKGTAGDDVHEYITDHSKRCKATLLN